MPTSHPAKKRHPRVPPVFVVNAALRLRRFLLDAADAVVPPYVAIQDRMFGSISTMLLHTAARLRIADVLKDGPLSTEEIASRVGAPAESLSRVLVALTAIGIFRRDAAGRFANNRTSTALITGSPGSARGFAEFFGYEQQLRAWSGLPTSLRTGESAFEALHGRTVWQWLDDAPDARAAFIDGMSAVTEMAAPNIAGSYPFGEIKKICDVGGGVGIVLAAVLSRHEHLRGMLFESESMLSAAPARLEAAGVADRVEMVAGSFLESVPRGADAYMVKTVLHNWNDEHVSRILKNCREAMDPGHRFLAVEFIAEPRPIAPIVSFMDMMMMTIFQNGRSRYVADFEKLYRGAGFELGRVIPIPGSLAIVEGIAR